MVGLFSAHYRVSIKVLRQEKGYTVQKNHHGISQQARFGGSCRSVCIAAGFMTLTSWSHSWSKSGNISTRCSSMKRSGSGVHVFELAFEHTEDILNTDFSYVWYLYRRRGLHFDSHVCTITGCAVAQHCYNGDVSFLWEKWKLWPL